MNYQPNANSKIMKSTALLLSSIFLATLIYKNYFIAEEISEVPSEVKSKQRVLVAAKKPEISTGKSKPMKKLVISRGRTRQKSQNNSNGLKSAYKKAEDYSFVDGKGNILLEQVLVVGDKVIAHGDVVIGDYKKLKNIIENGGVLKLLRPKLWTNGIIPYTISPELEDMAGTVENALKAFKKIKGLRLRTRTDEENYLLFKLGIQDCYSFLGMQGGEQAISLTPGCREKEIRHEFMHALGFLHEQNREDRDNFVTVLWPNIPDKHHPQFKKIPGEYMYGMNTSFDFNSIMLYPPNSFAIDLNDYTMVTIEGDPYPVNPGNLSPIDLERINTLYPAK